MTAIAFGPRLTRPPNLSIRVISMKIFGKVLLVLFAWGCALTLHAQAINGIKAIVHDSVVTFNQVDALTAPAAELLSRDYRTQPDVFRQKIREALDTSLEQLIDRQLIIHEFTGIFNTCRA